MEMMMFVPFHMAIVAKKPPAIAGGIRDLGSIPGPGMLCHSHILCYCHSHHHPVGYSPVTTPR